MSTLVLRHLNSASRAILATALVFLLLLSSFAGAEELTQDLSHDWKWKAEPGAKRGDTGDIRSGWQQPDLQDDDWDRLNVGKSWESQGKQYNGIAWYRKTFRLDAGLRDQELMLRLGTPNDGCEVYLNGQSLGVWRFKEKINVLIPSQLVRWEQPNVLAVRVWDWYKEGGLMGSSFEIQGVSTVAQSTTPVGAPAQSLSITSELPDHPLEAGRWQYGWRDEGTSDTRPRLRAIRKAFRGQDALELDAWYPNSTEFVDYELAPEEDGAAWERAGYTFLSFWYRTTDLSGDISIRLATGKDRWKRRVPVYQSLVRVKPGTWTQVVLPFSGFTKPNPHSTFDSAHRLGETSTISHLSIGFGNHHLATPGQIQFADFRVARSPLAEIGPASLHLPGSWKTISDSAAPALSIEQLNREDANLPWTLSSLAATKGKAREASAWYRQDVQVSREWRGKALRVVLGEAQGPTHVYWNGVELAHLQKRQPIVAEVAADQVRWDRFNTLIVHESAAERSFTAEGPFRLEPSDIAEVLLSAPDSGVGPTLPERFEMGAKPPASVDVSFTFALNTPNSAPLRLQYELMDCFDRLVASGETDLSRTEAKQTATIRLTAEQTRLLYYGEWFRVRAVIRDPHDQIVGAYALPDTAEKHFKLQYAQRDDARLSPLQGTTEQTPQGPLKLIDVIDASANPDLDPHPYKEGGIRNSWVGRRANFPWRDGVELGSLNGRQYREATNSQFFAYRVGRGQIEPHKAYLLRILVPDDKTRYFAMDIKAGRNSQGTGYKSVSLFDPTHTQPSGTYFWYDHIVVTDDVTYGYRGPRSVPSMNGFWVVFHDIGRAYAAAYDGGPAVAEIRLYEIPDDYSTAPKVPPDSRHTLMMDWERQPEAPPEDVVRYAKLTGLNALAPVIQKWSFGGFWHSSLGFAPPNWYKTAPPGVDDRDTYQRWLDATRQSGIKLIPRIEYGGGPRLPKEAWVIDRNGKIDRVGRYANWGANILHPATLREFKALIDELIGQHIDRNPQLAGVLWRQRQNRIKCSYGRRDVELFAAETGTKIPDGNAKSLAQWAFRNPAYARWWQTKRAQFLREVADYLRSYRNDLVLYYYNWDEDQFDPSIPGFRNTPSDWSDYYNVDRAREYERRTASAREAHLQTLPMLAVTAQELPHRYIDPQLLVDEPGIRILAPIPQPYFAQNEPYLRYFTTRSGLAVADILPYEEKARWNMQWDDYESSEMTLGPGPLSIANEQAAVRIGDANVITTTSYTYGRGWISEFRQFAEQFQQGR